MGPPVMKVVHVITGLGLGGAETMLWKILSSSSRKVVEHVVISIAGGGPLAVTMRAAGFKVFELDMRSWKAPAAFLRLILLVRRERPDVVQTWLYHGDLFGGLAARLAGVRNVVWNVRASQVSATSIGRATMAVVKLCALFSRYLPRVIICCSEASVRTHKQLGYATEKMRMIPNGFELERFRPDAAAAGKLRRELGIRADALVVGLVGRFNILKDHRTFLAAAGLVHLQFPDVHFVLCGNDIVAENAQLGAWVDEADLRDNIHLLGPRRDVPTLNAAFDVATCSSSSEGFPNVVGEAMACGVPCVVTDVGDCALIVGDTGIVVPPMQPALFADALIRMIELGPARRAELGRSARERVEKNFEIDEIRLRYERLYSEVVLEECR